MDIGGVFLIVTSNISVGFSDHIDIWFVDNYGNNFDESKALEKLSIICEHDMKHTSCVQLKPGPISLAGFHFRSCQSPKRSGMINRK